MYKEPSIISGTGDAIIAPLLELCQNGGLSVLSSIGKIEKIKVGGGRQSCPFSSKISWWKRKCEMVCCLDATASSLVVKLQAEVFQNFRAVAAVRQSSMRN
jgi:hypothetical protein